MRAVAWWYEAKAHTIGYRAHHGHIHRWYTKLPYAGISRIRFEGYVSTVAQWPRYPRFGRH
jgi:hypothetical protein